MSSPLMPILRQGAFSAIILFSTIVLALTAHVTHTTTTIASGYFIFTALGIAVAVLSLLSLPLMLILDNVRKGAFTSMIVVELGWLSLLWVLWLATAATASTATALNFPSGCSGPRSRRFAIIATTCREFSAIQAFSYLTWLVIFGYLGTLLIFSIITASRGYNRVWFQSVKETEFNAPPVVYNAPPVQTLQYMPPQDTGATQATYPTQAAYPPLQGSPAPGWNGQAQQAPISSPGSPYPQV